MFFMSGFQHALQLPHWPPWSGAGQVRVPGFVVTVDVLVQLITSGWSIIVPENLITRFEGARSIYFFVHASRVGIQCLTAGVLLQTSKIFAKCFRSCTSPASCHLKNLCLLTASLLILAAIARTHNGCLSAASLLYCDSRIAGNLV